MNEEINKKIAEWVGFSHYQIGEFAGGWVEPKHYVELIPNEGTFEIKGDPPDFTTSLDACFKYIEKPLVDHFIKTTNTENEYRYAYYNFLCRWLENYIWDEPHHSALAFCKAVEKLIDA